MTGSKFNRIPTEVELLAVSRQIDRTIAEQILHYAAEWSNGDENYQLDIINELVQKADEVGRYAWHDTIWVILMERINNLSSRVHDNVLNLASQRNAR